MMYDLHYKVFLPLKIKKYKLTPCSPSLAQFTQNGVFQYKEECSFEDFQFNFCKAQFSIWFRPCFKPSGKMDERFLFITEIHRRVETDKAKNSQQLGLTKF